MSFSPAQCRAARALLNWSQSQLAEVSKVATKTLADFERGSRTPYERTLVDIRAALEAAGIEFLNHGQPGVRMKASKQLRSGGENGYRYIGGVEFAMLNGADPVLCRVSDKALCDRDSQAESDYLGAFERHRKTIEAVAAAKFAAGMLEDGFVYVRSAELQAAGSP